MVSSLRPRHLAAALEFLAEKKALPFAGGTDLMVRHRGYTGTGPKIEGPVLFLDAVEELKNIAIEGDNLIIGAGVTLSRILAEAGLPELLRKAIELIAAPGLRNRATMAGNVCNASPAGDSIPPLYVHEAAVRLISAQGEREIPVADFLLGPGKTALKEGEILESFVIPLLPRTPGKGKLYYRKVGTRRANALSKLSCAGFALLESGRIRDFRFAVGAVAPTVVRIPEAEKLLRDTAPGELDWEMVRQAAEIRIHPIDDQRSTADYRKQTALNALHEFLYHDLHQAEEE